MKIFLSYSSNDRARVTVLAEELGLLGYVVWHDKELAGGDRWWQRILESIRSADIFIFCLSPSSINSKPCALEFAYAASLRKNLLPLYLTQLEDFQQLSPELQEVQIIPFYSNDLEYRRDLARSLKLLPPCPHLPVSLPLPPQLPLSNLSNISRRLRKTELGASEQLELFHALRELYENQDTSAQAKKLFRLFRENPAVLNTIAIDIDMLMRISSRAIRANNCHQLEESLVVRASSPVQALSFVPGSEEVAVSWADGTVVLCQEGGISKTLTINPGLMVSSMSFHPDLPVLFAAGTLDIVLRSQLSTHDPLGNPYNHKVGSVIATNYVRDEVKMEFTDFIEMRLDDRYSEEELAPPEGMINLFVRQGPTGLIRSGGGTFRAAAVSPDGEQLALGTDDRQCILWDLRWQRIVARLQVNQADSIRSVAFHPGGEFIVAGDYKGRILVWRMEDHSLQADVKAHEGPILSLSFTTDECRLAPCSRDGYIRLWKIDGWEELGTMGGGDSGMVGAVYSPVDSLLLSGARDGSIVLWDAERFIAINTLCQKGSKVCAVAWSDNGASIVAGTEDGEVRVWKLGNPRLGATGTIRA